MNLFDVLSSPAAHSTYLAGVVYAGAATLDRKMRKEALKDIAEFINRTSIFPDSHIVADFIYREFRLMFGERHFSIKCITRSIIASFIVISGILVFMLLLDTEEFRVFISLTHHNWRSFFGTLLAVISFSLVPDYVSLLKGRVLLKYMAFRPTALKIGLVCIADIVASVFVSLLTLAIIFCQSNIFLE
jgi:hypothetical protein